MQREGKISSVAEQAHGGFLFDGSDLDSASYMDDIAGGDLQIS